MSRGFVWEPCSTETSSNKRLLPLQSSQTGNHLSSFISTCLHERTKRNMRASRSEVRSKTRVILRLSRLYQDYGLLAQDAVYFYTCRQIYAAIIEAADFCETLITKKQRVTWGSIL